MPKQYTYETQITKFKTREHIAAEVFTAESVNSLLPLVAEWTKAELPDIRWGLYFEIPSNGCYCRRSKCRVYQQVLFQWG